jgi:hypothetical protein
MRLPVDVSHNTSRRPRAGLSSVRVTTIHLSFSEAGLAGIISIPIGHSGLSSECAVGYSPTASDAFGHSLATIGAQAPSAPTAEMLRFRATGNDQLIGPDVKMPQR